MHKERIRGGGRRAAVEFLLQRLRKVSASD